MMTMKLPIELTPVEGSSNIHALGYAAGSKHLYAQFSAGGPVYRYLEVEQATWDEMRVSESQGRYLAKSIKPTHKVEKLLEDVEE
jgi:hypothetical protein